MWRLLRRLGVAPSHLDDATHDVFVVAWRRLGEFRGRSALRTWLMGIAVRVASDYRRKAHRRFESLPDELPGLEDPEQQARERELITVTVGSDWTASAMAKRVVDGLARVDVRSETCGFNCRSLVVALEDQLALRNATAQVSQRLASCAFRLDLTDRPRGLEVELGNQALAPDAYRVAGDRVWLGDGACARYRAGAEVAFFAK
ncbi:MAG: sigma-70 family RNA polymerase sigma factor [Myxococcota bacterium]